METKHKIGDVVRVRYFDTTSPYYMGAGLWKLDAYHLTFVSAMIPFCGSELEIVEVGVDMYKCVELGTLEQNEYLWQDWMFEDDIEQDICITAEELTQLYD